MRRPLSLLAVGAILAGCGSTTLPQPSIASSTATSSAAASAAASAPSSLPSASGSARPATSPSAIAIDPSLLGLLPATLAGLDRQSDPDVDREAFSDPSLAEFATAGATSLYGDPTTHDFAFVTVLRLRSPQLDDATFRSYRDSFDAGACSQAGGVAGNAEAQIGGRTTYIGSCAGGLFTYHSVLPSVPAILSISSAGTRRLGETLAAAVRG